MSSRHDNLVSTLALTHRDPPLKNPGYAPEGFSVPVAQPYPKIYRAPPEVGGGGVSMETKQ